MSNPNEEFDRSKTDKHTMCRIAVTNPATNFLSHYKWQDISNEESLKETVARLNRKHGNYEYWLEYK